MVADSTLDEEAHNTNERNMAHQESGIDMVHLDSLAQQYEHLKEEFNEILNSKKRRPTFIEASEAEWDTIRDSIVALYLDGWRACDQYHTHEQRMESTLSANLCPYCQQTLETTMTEIYVIPTGKDIVGRLFCDACNYFQKPVDMVQYGLWPIAINQWIFFSFWTMEVVASLTNFNPLVSHTGIVNAFNFSAKRRGKNYILRPEAFNSSIREWKRVEMICLSKEVGGMLYECPACGDKPHCLHIDGNAKLYRYNSAGRYSGRAEPTDLLLNQEEVEEEVNRLRSSNVSVESVCGDTTWKAARSKGRAHAVKDETGLLLATCRHMFIYKALDMQRGEIYQYPYILQKALPKSNYVALDTVCKYWPWLEKVDPEMASGSKPMLSVMHAKAHTWTCQVKWSGKVIDGAGRSTGETTELANSYLSRLGPVTRHMTKQGRRIRLTEASGFWNVRKLLDLPKYLAESVIKNERLVTELKGLLDECCIKAGKGLEDLKRVAGNMAQIGKSARTATELQIEEVACRIARLEAQLNIAADSSKARALTRTKLSKQHERYRKLCTKYIQGNVSITYDEMMACRVSMQFPWYKYSSVCVFSNETQTALEVYHDYNRALEEAEILKSEKKQFMSFLVQKKSSSGSWILNSLYEQAELVFLADLPEEYWAITYEDRDLELQEDSDAGEAETDDEADQQFELD